MDNDLYKRVQETRSQFLKVELQTCFTALEMGIFEFTLGNIDIAQREAQSVDKGIQVIERFLPGLPEEQEPAVAAQLAELKEKLGSFKAILA